MTKSLNVAFASALFAAAVFGGPAAFAASDGEYYTGVSRHSNMNDEMIPPAGGEGLDLFSTQSINRTDGVTDPSNDAGPAEGDYYDGAVLDR